MKKIILMLSAIFLISFISASVTIIENPYDISQRIGESKTYSITINNSYNFDVSDFKFGNLTTMGFAFQNATTFANQTKTINFTVTPTSSFSGTKSEKIEFKFLANIPIEVTTYYVNITSGGFNPNYLTIRAGDTITWTNKDTIFHNVFSSHFNQNINPNETFSYTFTNTGIYNYIDDGWDEFNNFHGTIEVISRSAEEKVHNPNYDFIWNLNINFFLNPTNVTYELLDDSFEVSATGSTEGLIRVKNIGSERAERINLTANSNWIVFQENNFNLEPNEQNIITYDISPLIFNTNETNKTYNINLTIAGSNIDSQSKQISVFVPYTEIFQDTNSVESFLSIWDKFCKANPNNAICNLNKILNGTATIENGSNQNMTLNVSSVDFSDFLRRLFGIETTQTRQENKISSLEDKYGIVEDTYNLSNSSFEYQKEQDRIERRNSNVRWISGLFFVICGCILIMVWRYKNYRRKLLLKEGAYEYGRTY